MEKSLPVDVISYCGADGLLRPLRIRVPEKDAVGRVDEILQSGESRVLGAESVTFLCRIRYAQRPAGVLSQLKYHIRTRSWYLSRPDGSFARCASGSGDV